MNSIGIDYHKRYSVVCVMDEGGSILALSEGVSSGRVAAV
ncbi:MAG: IS110 family transposase [Kiritimatiellae bacterium]|nr:IS110 family transposase [Kiritimatiellia bacterium]